MGSNTNSSASTDLVFPLYTVLNASATPSQSYEPMISQEVYFFISLSFGGFAKLLISSFGVATNVINCLVFCTQGLQDRMNLCLFSLSLADLLYLGCSIVFGFVTLSKDLQLFAVSGEHYLKVVTYFTGVMYGSRTTSGLYIMLIAIERCVCVSFPLRAASLIATKTMGWILAAAGILPQLGFLCQPLKYHVQRTEVAGVSKWRLVPSQFWLDNKKVIDAIVYTMFTVSIPLITFFVVSLATFITVIQLRAAMTWRQQASSTSMEQNSQQVALTKTLVLASFLFIVSMTPMVPIKVVRLFVDEFSSYGPYTDLYMSVNIMANAVSEINSALTFVIYYNCSTRYRNVLRALCSHKVSNKESVKQCSLCVTLDST